MLRLTKCLASVVVATAAGLFAAGCESSNAGGDKHAGHVHGDTISSQTDGQGVTCDKCKVTWVKSPVTNQKGRVVAYTTKKSHECPDCRSAAENFFTTGNLKHDCATCGKDAMQKCEMHVSKS